MEELILKATYTEFLREYTAFYVLEYGQKKLEKISKQLHTSKKTQLFLEKAKQINKQLGSDDFLGGVHSIPILAIAKPESVATATIMLLCRWEEEVGKPCNLADDFYMNKIFFAILNKCDRYKVHLKSEPNFFKRFRLGLEKKYLKKDTAIEDLMDDIFGTDIFHSQVTKDNSDINIDDEIENMGAIAPLLGYRKHLIECWPQIKDDVEIGFIKGTHGKELCFSHTLGWGNEDWMSFVKNGIALPIAIDNCIKCGIEKFVLICNDEILEYTTSELSK